MRPAIHSRGYSPRVKIYTKRGDSGETDLFGGDRVSKSAVRVEAYGAVDELNAFLGVAATATREADLVRLCQTVQSELFDLGSLLATPDPAHQVKASLPAIGDGEIEALEAEIDRLEGELAPLQSFILPGGSPAGRG